MKSIILHGAEVRGLLRTGFVIVRWRFRDPKGYPPWHLASIHRMRVAHPAQDGSWLLWENNKPGQAEFCLKAYPSGGFRCPWGMPGEQRWVRECWSYEVHEQPVYRGATREMALDAGDPALEGWPVQVGVEREVIYLYRATEQEYKGPWRSATQMPQEASRLTVECESAIPRHDGKRWVWEVRYRLAWRAPISFGPCASAREEAG